MNAVNSIPFTNRVIFLWLIIRPSTKIRVYPDDVLGNNISVLLKWERRQEKVNSLPTVIIRRYVYVNNALNDWWSVISTESNYYTEITL